MVVDASPLGAAVVVVVAVDSPAGLADVVEVVASVVAPVVSAAGVVVSVVVVSVLLSLDLHPETVMVTAAKPIKATAKNLEEIMITP